MPPPEALFTVMVMVGLLSEPYAYLTKTQKLVVEVKAGVVKLAPVAPEMGFEVLPLVPSYHW